MILYINMLDFILALKVFGEIDAGFVVIFQDEACYFKLQLIDKSFYPNSLSCFMAYCNVFCLGRRR